MDAYSGIPLHDGRGREGHVASPRHLITALLGLAFFLAACSGFGADVFLLGGTFPPPVAFPLLDFLLDWAFPLPGAFPLLAVAWTLEPCLDFGAFPEDTRGGPPKQMVHRPTEGN